MQLGMGSREGVGLICLHGWLSTEENATEGGLGTMQSCRELSAEHTHRCRQKLDPGS